VIDRVNEPESDTIYIVDDDPSVVTALSRLTRTAGFQVEAYSSAREFLEHHRSDAPGCDILDVAIGDYSGLDLHQRLTGEAAAVRSFSSAGRATSPPVCRQ